MVFMLTYMSMLDVKEEEYDVQHEANNCQIEE